MRHLLLIVILSCLTSILVSAQGIRGTVKSEEGELLPFATIYIKELGTGTTTNGDALFEIKMAPGNYSVVFQFVGFEAQERSVTVADGFTELNIIMKPQIMVLQDIEVRVGKEDPAYTIMRKAIAKSKYHTQQVDSYSAKVYMKGTGQLKDAPFFLEKTLEKEGVEEGQVFVSESVSEIEYTRPNTYNEKVISIRSSGDDKNGSPNAYINGSFYEPEVAQGVSPLSPRAFSYYKFVYEGTHRDRGFEISKIRVIPRSQGDNVFKGYIEIVEDYWSIYSLNLSVSKMGINFLIKQFYEPVEQNVWLPVTHDFLVDGKVFGFEFEGKYLATVSDYKVEVNPELDVEFEVVDEKLEKELATKLDQQVKSEETKEIQEILTSGKEVTRKQLRKLVKAYEKAEQQQTDEPEVVSNRTYKIDTLAYKNDSTYWAQIRPIPLSKNEVDGYAKMDSLSEIQQNERDGDTLKTKKRKAKHIFDPIFGNYYKLADKTYLQLYGLSGQFNTVDGFDLETRLVFTKTFDNENKNWLRINHQSRYTFARTAYNGILEFRYDFGERGKRNSLRLNGGRYINQYNNDQPIHPIINTFTTLIQEFNYMKIYEKDYAEIVYDRKLWNKLNLNIKGEFAERRELKNRSSYNLVDRSQREYTPNAPVAAELPNTSFEEHNALTTEVNLAYEPWVKYRIYNGRKQKLDTYTPKFRLKYVKGIPDVADSKVDFDLLELGYRHTFKLGIRALADVSLKAGKFLNNESLYFMDYKHFLGNRTPFVTTDPVGSFRMLDYYVFSTSDEYFTGSFHYQMRKFLFTRIPIVRLAGVRESFFTNYLATDLSKNYTEVGYGINYIFRLFRVEAVANFVDGKYKDYGVRIGIAANLDNLF